MCIAKVVKGWGTMSFVFALWLAAPGVAPGAERDLGDGLASLRAGAQLQAEQQLTRYRDGELDSEIRRSIDRVLPLLRRPLNEDVREYIAGTIEDGVRGRARLRTERTRPSYALRMFPVFP